MLDRERSETTQLGRARGIHSITVWPQPPPQGSALLQGCILPAHLPAQGIRGFSQGKDRQSCAAVAAPVIPGRTDVEVTLEKLGRRLGSPFQGGGGFLLCSVTQPLCESPLPGSLRHKAPTAEAGSSSGLAGLDEGRTVEG